MKPKTIKQLENREWWWRKGSDFYRWDLHKSQFDFRGLKVEEGGCEHDAEEWDKFSYFSRASYFYELARRGRKALKSLPRWDALGWNEQFALRNLAIRRAAESGADYTVVYEWSSRDDVKPDPGFVVLDKWAWNLAASPKQLTKRFLEVIANESRKAGIQPRKKGEKNANRRESWKVIEVLDLHRNGIKSHKDYNSGQASAGQRKAEDAEREFVEFLKAYRKTLRGPSAWDAVDKIDARGS